MYTSITNFKYGLDSRRSKLASMPGSLRTASDGHINQGGSFELRNAFAKVGSWPANVFGLEITSNGLVVFGSVATPVGLPSGVSYVRCQHPSDNTKSMTAVLCSCSFGGKAWCAARFSNNDVFIYYNGTVVPASMNGKVLSAATSNLAVATQLYNFLNTSYFASAGLSAVAPVANGAAYYVDIYGAPGVAISFPTPAITNGGGGTGNISTQMISNSSIGQAATAASFGFLCSMGTIGTLASIKASTDNGATFGVDLLSASIPWVTNDTSGYQTALNVAALITGTISVLPASATASNNKVTLAIDPTLGSNPNGYPLKFTTTGDFCLDFLTIDFTGASTLSSSSVTVGSLQTVALNSTYGGGGSFTVSLPAGTYFYHKGATGINISYTSGSLITLSADTAFTLSATTTVTVTGSANATVADYITLMVEILGTTVTGATKPLFIQALATRIRSYSADYTACASTYNSNHLIISRKVVRTDYSFYPVLSCDVSGATSTSGQVVTTIPTVTLTYISYTAASGAINVSIVGGSFPVSVNLNLDTLSGTVTSIAPVVYLPNGSTDTSTTIAANNSTNLVVASSFLMAVAATAGGSGANGITATAKYVLTIRDVIGNLIVKNITMTATQNNGVIQTITFTYT